VIIEECNDAKTVLLQTRTCQALLIGCWRAQKEISTLFERLISIYDDESVDILDSEQVLIGQI
jgi:hypothetical protein